jgi:hypothetical protein
MVSSPTPPAHLFRTYASSRSIRPFRDSRDDWCAAARQSPLKAPEENAAERLALEEREEKEWKDEQLRQEELMRLKIRGDSEMLTQITTAIHVSNWDTSLNINHLKNIGISDVLCIANEKKDPEDICFYLSAGMAHWQWDVEDALDVDIITVCIEAAKVLNNVVRSRGKALVHCMIGMSRSVSVVVFYLMRYCGMSYDGAIAHIRKARWFARPNKSFERQLRKWRLENPVKPAPPYRSIDEILVRWPIKRALFAKKSDNNSPQSSTRILVGTSSSSSSAGDRKV